ncbi:MAG: biopolymer transporter ExbD [Acidovorax sp.]
MNFRPRAKEEPEINLIPFIDVLLVILIFLMLSTTYSKFTELQVTLPVADTEQMRDRPREVIVAVAADGRYAVNQSAVEGKGVEAVARALSQAAKAPSKGDAGSIVVISADALAPHQAVITVMEAARRAGLSQITFATQSSARAGGR